MRINFALIVLSNIKLNLTFVVIVSIVSPGSLDPDFENNGKDVAISETQKSIKMY